MRKDVTWFDTLRELLELERVEERARLARDRQTLPLAELERAVLQREVSFYRGLPAERRAAFEARVERFLSEHPLEAHGAVLDTETRVLIAASAATLLLGRARPLSSLRARRDQRRVQKPVRWPPRGTARARAPARRRRLGRRRHPLDDGVGPAARVARPPAARGGPPTPGESALDKYGATDSAELFAGAGRARAPGSRDGVVRTRPPGDTGENEQRAQRPDLRAHLSRLAGRARAELGCPLIEALPSTAARSELELRGEPASHCCAKRMRT